MSGSETGSLGQRIRRLRNLCGLKSHVLAIRAGISPVQLSRIECGKAQPTLATVKKIANALKVSPKDLIDEPEAA